MSGTPAGPTITRSQRILRDRERQGFDMGDPLAWNAKTIAEFSASEGRVGGTFEGAPLVLAEQARRYPGFAEYARQAAGVRTIPVLERRRA